MPSKTKLQGNQCKSYGAAAIMRVPGRLHITWQDANTLKVEMDSGTRHVSLYFGAPAAVVAKGEIGRAFRSRPGTWRPEREVRFPAAA